MTVLSLYIPSSKQRAQLTRAVRDHDTIASASAQYKCKATSPKYTYIHISLVACCKIAKYRPEPRDNIQSTMYILSVLARVRSQRPLIRSDNIADSRPPKRESSCIPTYLSLYRSKNPSLINLHAEGKSVAPRIISHRESARVATARVGKWNATRAGRQFVSLLSARASVYVREYIPLQYALVSVERERERERERQYRSGIVNDFQAFIDSAERVTNGTG